MGYYTNYRLDIVDTKDAKEEYLDRIGVYEDEEDGDVDHEAQIEERYPGASFEDSTKWYDHDEEMKEYSKEYPNVVFELNGEGEEAGDLWRKYYKNGKVQVSMARILFDTYDESKLE